MVGCASLARADKNDFGGNVADEVVAGERAAAKAGERGIETSAAGGVSGEDFIVRAVQTRVKMNTKLHACDMIFHLL